MSNGDALLALTLGLGGGLVLAYLRSEQSGESPAGSSRASTPSGPPPTTVPPAVQAPADGAPVAARACSLKLDARGLTADGTPTDVKGAVARCTSAGRADLLFADDGPASLYVELCRALSRAGILVTVRGP